MADVAEEEPRPGLHLQLPLGDEVAEGELGFEPRLPPPALVVAKVGESENMGPRLQLDLTLT